MRSVGYREDCRFDPGRQGLNKVCEEVPRAVHPRVFTKFDAPNLLAR